MAATALAPLSTISRFVPKSLRVLADHQRDLPRIAKDAALVAEIEVSLRTLPERDC